MTQPVQLAIPKGEGPIQTPFGPVAPHDEAGDVVLIGLKVIAAAALSPERICRAGRRAVGDGYGTVSRDGFFELYARDDTIRYELFPVEWSDTPDGKPFLYLGVRRR